VRRRVIAAVTGISFWWGVEVGEEGTYDGRLDRVPEPERFPDLDFIFLRCPDV
jgi:hypothetical protein